MWDAVLSDPATAIVVVGCCLLFALGMIAGKQR